MDGEEIGEIDDLVLRRNGRIKQAVLSVGGFLGIGDKEVGIPFKSLKINSNGTIVYEATRQQLENHKEFNYGRQELFRGSYIRQRPYGQMRPGYPRRFSSQGELEAPGYYSPYWPYYRFSGPPWAGVYLPERMLVSVLFDNIVANFDGVALGALDDFLIGPDGNVEKIVLSVGGFLGIGDKLVAVPYETLTITHYGIYYDASQKEMQEAPAYNYPSP